MENNTLKLTDGREVKLIFSMNALINYSELTGKDLDSLEMKETDVRALRDLGWAMAKDGEESEGRELGMTPEEFGRKVTPEMIIDMVEIMRQQFTGKKKAEAITSPPPRKGRPLKIFFRKKA